MAEKIYEVFMPGKKTHEVIANNPEKATITYIYWICHGDITRNYSKLIGCDPVTVSEMIDRVRVYRKYAIYFDPDIQCKLIAVSSEIVP